MKWNWLQLLFQAIAAAFRPKQPAPAPLPPAVITPPPPIAPEPPTPTTPDPDVLEPWGDPISNRHNVRVIADQEGLTVDQKNLLSQVIHCESGYHTLAVHPNLYEGNVVSTDRGICQWNDKYHGAEITPEEAFHDPEKCVRLMCKYLKAGQIKLWVCYSSGLYKKYTP